MSGTLALAGPALNAAGASDAGRVRRGNEDRYYIDAEHGIFLVADGVGGRAAGEVASAIAVDVIASSLPGLPGPASQRVREAIALANNEIHRQAQQSDARRGMTCVLTLALLEGQRLTVGHVGDSRLYTFDRAGIGKVTRDHSPVGEQEDNQEISEEAAMRHPRRNEVFRDVGAVPHHANDPEFVDVFETPFGDGSALLLCSDGLSDMLPSASIDQLVRRHAGDAQAVARALIDAANEAGGRDNVTVVYAEGPAFATAAAASDGRSTRPPARAAWLVAGVAIGLAVAFALLFWVDLLPGSWRARTLIVGGTSSPYASIAAAMMDAGPNDVVQIEPGTYQEEVVLADGVEVRASVPGAVVLAAPPGRTGWVSLTSTGPRGNTLSGIRILGTPDAPIAVGLKLERAGTLVDDLLLEGNIDVGIDVQNDRGSVLRSSRFEAIHGVPLRIGGTASPVVRQNLFVQGPHETGPAVHVQGEAEPSLSDNVFVGFAEPIGAPPARREHLLRDNYVIRDSARHPVRSTP